MLHDARRPPCLLPRVVIVCLVGLTVAVPGLSSGQSPYRLDPTREIVILSAGLGTGIAALVAQDAGVGLSVEEVNALSRTDVNPFDRGATWQYSNAAATASDVVAFSVCAAPAMLLLDDDVRSEWETFAVMYGEALLLTGAFAQFVKAVAQRTRPFVYNPDAPMEGKTSFDALKSFYSSHTSLAFMSAVFLSTTYDAYCPESQWRWLVWTGSIAAAAAVGLLRYQAGMHFPTDILMGASVGAALGYLVPYIHTRNGDGVGIIPAAPGATYGMTVRVRF